MENLYIERSHPPTDRKTNE